MVRYLGYAQGISPRLHGWKSRSSTVFISPRVLYEWLRIPFGLWNAPLAFQKYVHQVLGEKKYASCTYMFILAFLIEFDLTKTWIES